MSTRNLDPSMSKALSAGLIMPVILVMLTFKSKTQYVWSGTGTLVFDSQPYLGIGSLGSIAAISEGTTVNADGTTVTLSGIDPSLLAESLTDIRLGAPAKIWFALMTNGALIGSPYLVFSGLVDQPVVQTGVETITISLKLENRLVDLARASMKRFTSADQQLKYPDDTGFNFVEITSDIALKWGN